MPNQVIKLIKQTRDFSDKPHCSWAAHKVQPCRSCIIHCTYLWVGFSRTLGVHARRKCKVVATVPWLCASTATLHEGQTSSQRNCDVAACYAVSIISRHSDAGLWAQYSETYSWRLLMLPCHMWCSGPQPTVLRRYSILFLRPRLANLWCKILYTSHSGSSSMMSGGGCGAARSFLW